VIRRDFSYLRLSAIAGLSARKSRKPSYADIEFHVEIACEIKPCNNAISYLVAYNLAQYSSLNKRQSRRLQLPVTL
jgi:hypothetical protein